VSSRRQGDSGFPIPVFRFFQFDRIRFPTGKFACEEDILCVRRFDLEGGFGELGLFGWHILIG